MNTVTVKFQHYTILKYKLFPQKMLPFPLRKYSSRWRSHRSFIE